MGVRVRRDLPARVSITTAVFTSFSMLFYAIRCESIPPNDMRGSVSHSSRDAPEADPDIVLSDRLCSITDKPFLSSSLGLSFARSY